MAASGTRWRRHLLRRRVTEPGRGRHVVMLVRNPYTHDTRVEKEARTLAAAATG